MEQRTPAEFPAFSLAQGAAILVALALDAWGEPPAAWHPVVWFGTLISRLERLAPRGRVLRLLYGGAMLLLAAPFALLPASLLHRLARRLFHDAQRGGSAFTGCVLFALLEGAGLKPWFALRALLDAGRSVRLALEQHDLAQARDELHRLVSRDRSQLTAEEAGAAAIESLAENLSDSVIAPLFWYLLAGLPGAAIYRLANTFDAMIGYHGLYEDLGKAAARFDDLLNLLPARVTALLLIAMAPLFGGNQRRAWTIWRRDAHKTASPNAGHPMAAMAGALGLRLEKIGHYQLGDPDTVLRPRHLRQAEQMVRGIGGLVFVLAALLQLVRGGFVWRRI
jgi:adenosylcobinamide-phosphate synthase